MVMVMVMERESLKCGLLLSTVTAEIAGGLVEAMGATRTAPRQGTTEGAVGGPNDKKNESHVMASLS